jgi:hypothetical protein
MSAPAGKFSAVLGGLPEAEMSPFQNTSLAWTQAALTSSRRRPSISSVLNPFSERKLRLAEASWCAICGDVRNARARTSSSALSESMGVRCAPGTLGTAIVEFGGTFKADPWLCGSSGAVGAFPEAGEVLLSSSLMDEIVRSRDSEFAIVTWA